MEGGFVYNGSGRGLMYMEGTGGINVWKGWEDMGLMTKRDDFMTCMLAGRGMV